MGRCVVFNPTIGSKGEDRDVPIDQLNIDIYQRPPMSDQYINNIARNWDWDKVGRLWVADRNGTLWVVDGQQRLLAARRRGDIKTPPCIVRLSPGIEYEALMFRTVNTIGTRRPGLVQSYKSGLIGKETFCVQIEEFVSSRGYQIVKGECNNGIQCIGAIARLYQQNKANLFKALDLCMKISKETFPITKDLLCGAYSLCANGIILDNVAVRKLHDAGAKKIQQEMNLQKAASGTDGGRSQAKAMLKIVNYGRLMKNRISLPENSV